MPEANGPSTRDFVGHDDLVFSFGPSWNGDVPAPFEVVANTVRLVDAVAPRVLILGFGLGAMARIVRKRRPAARITGVEPDVDLVRRSSAAEDLAGVELHRLSARDFLQRVRPPQDDDRFDLVIDDCFEMRGDEPVRPSGMNESAEWVAPWLQPRGIVVRNLLPEDGPVEEQTRDLAKRFRHRLVRRFRDWENVVVLTSSRPFPAASRAQLRPRLHRLPGA
ncbi:MAG: class I SAM-dependent methyltransferase [Acidobacteria bacterium]|nr:MAG: class I SAM-dependent methyltransferase [Acidobacteriota bacterium]REK09179.1 MAG: class I SAM-dependent methyltransferase [Acidobacteriota bacterium]